MPHSHGYNNGTRDMLSRPFRKAGTIPMSTYLIKYKIGDYVDIKANGAVHDGRPVRVAARRGRQERACHDEHCTAHKPRPRRRHACARRSKDQTPSKTQITMMGRR